MIFYITFYQTPFYTTPMCQHALKYNINRRKKHAHMPWTITRSFWVSHNITSDILTMFAYFSRWFLGFKLNLLNNFFITFCSRILLVSWFFFTLSILIIMKAPGNVVYCVNESRYLGWEYSDIARASYSNLGWDHRRRLVFHNLFTNEFTPPRYKEEKSDTQFFTSSAAKAFTFVF